MIPVWRSSRAGQHHKKGATLQSRRPRSDFHEYHPDTKYCRALVSF